MPAGYWGRAALEKVFWNQFHELGLSNNHAQGHYDHSPSVLRKAETATGKRAASRRLKRSTVMERLSNRLFRAIRGAVSQWT
jgi:hypothetical protein